MAAFISSIGLSRLNWLSTVVELKLGDVDVIIVLTSSVVIAIMSVGILMGSISIM